MPRTLNFNASAHLATADLYADAHLINDRGFLRYSSSERGAEDDGIHVAAEQPCCGYSNGDESSYLTSMVLHSTIDDSLAHPSSTAGSPVPQPLPAQMSKFNFTADNGVKGEPLVLHATTTATTNSLFFVPPPPAAVSAHLDDVADDVDVDSGDYEASMVVNGLVDADQLFHSTAPPQPPSSPPSMHHPLPADFVLTSSLATPGATCDMVDKMSPFINSGSATHDVASPTSSGFRALLFLPEDLELTAACRSESVDDDLDDDNAGSLSVGPKTSSQHTTPIIRKKCAAPQSRAHMSASTMSFSWMDGDVVPSPLHSPTMCLSCHHPAQMSHHLSQQHCAHPYGKFPVVALHPTAHHQPLHVHHLPIASSFRLHGSATYATTAISRSTSVMSCNEDEESVGPEAASMMMMLSSPAGTLPAKQKGLLYPATTTTFSHLVE